jgi:hypothetical protein
MRFTTLETLDSVTTTTVNCAITSGRKWNCKISFVVNMEIQIELSFLIRDEFYIRTESFYWHSFNRKRRMQVLVRWQAFEICEFIIICYLLILLKMDCEIVLPTVEHFICVEFVYYKYNVCL